MAMAENDRGETASSKEGEASWGTFEELLLACAVCRHGTTSWDSIAMEVQTHTTNNNSLTGFTPHNCRQRYNALKRRFDVTGECELREKVPLIVDELRKIRVEELRREVERHDVSIVSLELKVKRLEEERENESSEPEPVGGDGGSDLAKRDDRPDGSDLAEKSISGDRSFNESNSTSHKGGRENRSTEPEPIREVAGCEPDKSEPVRQGDSGELRESVSESKREGKQGSDVQSSARRGGGGDELEAEEELSPAYKRMGVRSQPLIKLLGIVRSHEHGVVFQRRLPSQETEEYRNVVRQYMDLETVQAKLDRGIYCDCQSKFYRDILLVFTNATLFFRKTTTEHMAAHELRMMVTKEIVAQRLAPKPKPAQLVKPVTDLESQIDPVVKKPRTSTNIVVCRRRTNPNAIKPISLSSQQNAPKGKEEEDENAERHKDEPKKLKERSNLIGRTLAKTVISNNNSGSSDKKKGMVPGESNNSNNASASNNRRGKKDESSDDEEEQPINKRQRLLHPSSKKQGVVNFLKRIKQNSPSKEALAGANDSEEEQEEKVTKKMEISKKKVGTKKDNGEDGAGKDDNAIQRRISGRRTTRVGDETGRSGNAKRGGGRPPTRKATAMGDSGGTPDSGKGKRQRDGDREKEVVGTSGRGTNNTAKKKSRR